jgi:DNA ligase-1
MSTPPLSDATIIDALALVHSDDVDVGQAINHAYNCMADLGLVARLLWETGAKPLLSAKPKVGVPVHPESQTRRRLVELDQVWQDFGECWVHTKYDGYRCQIHKLDEDVRLFVGRAVGDWSERLPMVVYAVRKQIDARSVILDSEVVPYDDAAKRILPRKEFHKAKTYKVIVFDLLSLDGEDWRRYPYSERHAMKLNLVRQHVDPGVVDFSRDKYVTSSRQLHEFAERCKRAGEEGFIAIRPSATYQSSYSGIRSRDRLKVKAVDPVDAVIVGYDVSSARTSNDAVAFLVAAYDTERDEFVTIGKAVSGLTAVERDCLQRHCRDLEVEHIPPGVNSRLRPDHWVKPQLVVELEVDYIYPSEEYTCGLAQEGVGYGMQNAVFVSGEPRDDKGPEQATTAVEFLLIRREPGLIPFRPASDERSSYTDPSEPTAQQSQLRLFW